MALNGKKYEEEDGKLVTSRMSSQLVTGTVFFRPKLALGDRNHGSVEDRSTQGHETGLYSIAPCDLVPGNALSPARPLQW